MIDKTIDANNEHVMFVSKVRPIVPMCSRLVVFYLSMKDYFVGQVKGEVERAELISQIQTCWK